MSEADNHTNWPFPKPLTPIDVTAEDGADTYRSDLLDEEMTSVNVPASHDDSATDSRWVELTADGLAAISPDELAELIALVQEMRSANRNLAQRVAGLSQALSESQEALNWHKERLQTQESLLTQQAQELANAQEQVRYLFHELEASHQTAQRQQILIETLTDQLEISQERVAQVERECALTQQRYNEQSYQLVQTENTCKDLRNRLARQQRHTLQFKAALEKSLEVPVSSYQFQNDTDSPEVAGVPSEAKQEPHSLPLQLKAQPIPPWSAEPEAPIHTIEPLWDMLLSTTDGAVFPDSVNKVVNPQDEESTLSRSYDPEPPVLEQLVETTSDAVLPQQESESFTPNTNWPAPVVYPLRPPKGRKSLAAVELPTFPFWQSQ